jgi:predicted NBD/HSP70 family sugar kinase
MAESRGTDVPLELRNGADLAALAEHVRGAAVGCDNLVYLHGDAGVGGGIIATGRPVEHALIRAAGRDGTGRAAVAAVVDAAGRGDALAQAALRQVGDWIGFGVANLVNIFNPEMVIFGGTLRGVYLASAAQVRTRLNKTSLPALREHVRLRTPNLGEDAMLIGAAELAFERLLTGPIDVASSTNADDERADDRSTLD